MSDILGAINQAYGVLDMPSSHGTFKPILAYNFPVERLGTKPEYPPSSAVQIANQCAQLARMRDTKGAVSEPEWRNSLGVIKHSTEGDALAHEWSKGDPRYDEELTQEKLDRWETGPTTCEQFERTASHLCASCKFKGKMTSPIQLGYTTVIEPVKVISNLPRLASADGLIKFSDIPPAPRVYVLQDLIVSVKVCVLAGLGGVSKTMLAMQWAVCVALGLPYMGKATLAGTVLFILGEEDSEEIARRFNAIVKFMKLSRQAATNTTTN